MSHDLVSELDRALHTLNDAAARSIVASSVATPRLDDILVLLARRAQDDALSAVLLIEALDASGTVRRFAHAAVLDHGAVDDISQEALISIADSIGSYDGRAKVTTWVHSIVRRRVADHLRRQRDTAPLDEHTDTGASARMSSMIATRATVQQALNELPELYRAPVVLRDMDGQSYAEIARHLDRREGTIKAQISRGRAMVAARLQTGHVGKTE